MIVIIIATGSALAGFCAGYLLASRKPHEPDPR